MTSTDSSGQSTDRAMTRSEERLTVGTRRHVTGRVRLQKFITTETVTVDVQVRREEVRLVHEPADGTDLAGDSGGWEGGRPGDPSRKEVVLVLHEERPVVTVQVVPVERVRLVVDQVATTQTVSGQVRKEQIELEQDVDPGTRTG